MKFRLNESSVRHIVKHVKYSLKGGFLVRPILIAFILGCIGVFISTMEESHPWISRWVPFWIIPSTSDPTVAQNILSNITTAMMTVVSIVFAVLLMTLTLASTQFSPRIIISFVRDKITQQTLGIYLGTFLYCLGTLPVVRTTAPPFSPVASVLGAMLLALACVLWLLIFINHISTSVNVNHIVHNIARETEDLIKELMPNKRVHGNQEGSSKVELAEGELKILSRISGYIIYVDAERLFALARKLDVRIVVLKRVGNFVPSGVPLMSVLSKQVLSSRVESQLRDAIDIGPTRLLDQDIEFGVLQIVDIALRAVSQAVNDPSTAITCIDQLSSIMINFASRESPQTMFYSPSGTLRLKIPTLRFAKVEVTAFEQVRMFSKADLAVNLRLLKAFIDIAITLPPGDLRGIFYNHGKILVNGCSENFSKDDLAQIKERMLRLERIVEASY